ncbi:hypothetical protein [Bacillus taeanensis]|uniref:Uncharacterized protein n=1 Tax=Bacillus taeanensis TaxID=273032 RepID=A0A366XSA4_9BACI|nr:hypothetical protein [Bacillus taeanensis]RBW68428.1 hypothetical protein DS031_16555 [Bacillus taeanensis]
MDRPLFFYRLPTFADGKDISTTVLLFLTLKKNDPLQLMIECPDSAVLAFFVWFIAGLLTV